MSAFDIIGVPLGLKKKPPKVDPKYATFNRRMLAATIDFGLLAFVAAPLIEPAFAHFWPVAEVDTNDMLQKIQANPDHAAGILIDTMASTGAGARWLADNVLQFSLFAILSAVCWHFWSATPGKMLLRVKIVDAETEASITDRQIVLRTIGYFLSSLLFCIGFLWICFDKRRQGWHDKIAGTAVIVKPRKKRKVTPGSETALPSGSPAPSKAE